MPEYLEIIDYVSEPNLSAVQALNNILHESPLDEFEVVGFYQDNELNQRILVKITRTTHTGG